MSQIYLIFVTDSQSKSTLRTELHEFGYNRATKCVYSEFRSAATEGEMTKQDTEKRPAQETQPAPQAEAATHKRTRPVAGFVIAGASLALLFGLAALKGRVKDDN